MLTVACALWQPETGGDYNATYVEKLRDGVARNLKSPHRFVCFSNVDVPCERIPLKRDWPGWWSKMEFFDPDNKLGNILTIDLDTVIVGDLEQIASVGEFTMIESWHDPERGRKQSGFMMLTPKARAHIWKAWIENPAEHMRKYRGDQEWLHYVAPFGCGLHTWDQFCPKQIVSYKYHCRSKGDKLPPAARVICFHGNPRPHEMPADHWTMRHW